MKQTLFAALLLVLLACGCRNGKADGVPAAEITAEMAYEGVSNFCHDEYDWSPADDNPEMMTVTMGEESDSAYQVVFRSYTGALVYFNVDKASGTTKMVEYVPTLDIQNDAGTINLFDYLEK